MAAKQAVLIIKNLGEIIGPFKSFDDAVTFGNTNFPNKSRSVQELVSATQAKTLLSKKLGE